MRDAAARLSPRARRWRAILRSCQLDPSALDADTMEQPPANSFLICGVPRSGTALLTAQLFQPPRVITVMEPWDGMRWPPGLLLRSLRAEILSGTLSRGRLDIPALARDGDVRWVGDKELSTKVNADADFLLGVKWPAFWRYLDLLPETKFLVCIRDPVEVVTSFRQTGGRLAQGLDYDITFNRAMNQRLLAATSDAALRRVLLFDYITERILPHLERPNIMAVRYERWFSEPEALLTDIEQFLGVASLAPGPAHIRPVSRSIGSTEAAFVAEHCATAPALGYGAPSVR